METLLVIGLVWFAVSVPVALIVGRAMRRVSTPTQPEPVQVTVTEAPPSGKLVKASNP